MPFEKLQYFEPSTSLTVTVMIPERSQQTLTDMLGISDLTGLARLMTDKDVTSTVVHVTE